MREEVLVLLGSPLGDLFRFSCCTLALLALRPGFPWSLYSIVGGQGFLRAASGTVLVSALRLADHHLP